MAAPLPAIVRPDGRIYQPRKITAHLVETFDTFGDHAVVVTGTHDVERARDLADILVAAEIGATYRAAEPELAWLRDGMANGGRAWIPDVRRGAAVVYFRQIDEVPHA